MRSTRTLGLAVIALAAIALAACSAASTGTQGGQDTFLVPIEVDNNLSGLTGATIYIVRSTGTNRRLLGPVESGRKNTFNYDASIGSYRLIARQGVGMDSIVSEQFRLDPGVYVQWSLGVNRLLLGTR